MATPEEGMRHEDSAHVLVTGQSRIPVRPTPALKAASPVKPPLFTPEEQKFYLNRINRPWSP